MEADANMKQAGIELFMLNLVRNHLPVDDEPADHEEKVSQRWLYAVMAIAVSLALLRLQILGFPN